jgi:type IV pilus assembly protein PilV
MTKRASTSRHTHAMPARHRGISLIELLVSLLIFSFGMLGLAGLQTRALSFSQSSMQRSLATSLTDDILDRMRADRANAINNNWDTALTDTSSSITGSLLYQTDLKDWKQAVEATLPEGRASVGVDVNGVVTIVVEWSDSRGKDNPLDTEVANQQWTTKTQL